jgi:tetratricopeptide (TPR) repeat protein
VSELLRRQPRSVEALRLSGRIRAQEARFAEASGFLERAVKLAPNDAHVAFDIGHARLLERREREALARFDRCESLAPDHPEARICRAESLRRMGDARAAIALLGEPTTAAAAQVIAAAHAALGDDAAALRIARRGLTLPMANRNVGVVLRHHLAAALERQGDHAAAFAVMAERRAAEPQGWRATELRTEIDRLKETFSIARWPGLARSTVRSARPVFIAAMPRSGTTLVDRVIARHSRGAGAGETTALADQVRSWFDLSAPSRSWPMLVRGFLPRDLDAIATRYLAETEPFAVGADRVADKHLHNWLMVGLIAIAFPDAAIIALEREPMDVGLSCFERLSARNQPWSTDLAAIGTVLARNEELMQHWSDLLGPRLLRLSYEAAVRDPRREFGRVLEAIGLPWEDQVLEHRAAAPSRRDAAPTLSSDAVRRPVHDAAIGRAARFGACLEPMRAAYRASGGRRAT